MSTPYQRLLRLAREAGLNVNESDDPNSTASWWACGHYPQFAKLAQLLVSEPTVSDQMKLIKCGSHRARRKVFSIIPERNSLYSFRRATGKGVYLVTPDEFSLVRDIKGVSGFRNGDDLLRCWG
jgi:hypothetical protein